MWLNNYGLLVLPGRTSILLLYSSKSLVSVFQLKVHLLSCILTWMWSGDQVHGKLVLPLPSPTYVQQRGRGAAKPGGQGRRIPTGRCSLNLQEYHDPPPPPIQGGNTTTPALWFICPPSSLLRSDYKQTFFLRAVKSIYRYRIVLPEDLISITKSDARKLPELSHCRYRFSLEFE